jgi:ABC-type sugar transport system ATPase subunit
MVAQIDGQASPPITLLETCRLSKRFPGVVAVDEVSLAAPAGEVHALVGANGAGKSTLMNLLAGVFPPTSGTIRVEGQEVAFASPREAREKGIAIVYQEFSSIAEFSVARNVYLGREPAARFGWVDRGLLCRSTQALLDAHRLPLDAATPVALLRVAQRQLVEIARALSSAPRILILDEPTAVLSPGEQENLFSIVDRLRKSGLLILYVSHRLEELFAISDRISVLRDGRLIETVRAADISPPELVRLMTGHNPGKSAGSSVGGATGEEILRIRRAEEDGASEVVVHRGEIVGLAGLVGSGRSRLARTLVGLSGGYRLKIEFEGQPIKIRSPRDALDHGIVYLTEDRRSSGMFAPLSIVANSTAAALDRFSRFGAIARRKERSAASAMLEQLRLVARSLAAPVSQLSGGNQQKLLLARALLCNPKLLICDEPTRGIDVATKDEIYGLLRRLAADGMAIILISSEFKELLLLSSRIAAVRDGAIVACFDAREVDEHRLLLEATGTARPRRAESSRSRASVASG